MGADSPKDRGIGLRIGGRRKYQKSGTIEPREGVTNEKKGIQ